MNVPMTARSAQMPVVEKLSRKLTSDTSVAEFGAASPAFCKPIKAINNPMPTETACLSERGMQLKIASRTFVTDMMMKMMPSMNTASSATCHE